MKGLPIPLPLLFLVSGTAVAAVVFVLLFDPASFGKSSDAEMAVVRLRVLGFDREPRRGVTLILVKNAASEPLFLTPSGPDGLVDARVPRGVYDLKVYPKKLSTRAARSRFRAERGLGPREMEANQLFVATLAVPPPAPNGRIDVRLPAAASY